MSNFNEIDFTTTDGQIIKPGDRIVATAANQNGQDIVRDGWYFGQLGTGKARVKYDTAECTRYSALRLNRIFPSDV